MGPPASYRVSRVRYYSGVIYVYPDFVYGSFTLFARLFQNRSTILLESFLMIRNPDNKLSVWPPSRSLAATWEIDVSFFSWGYLDVSVHPVSRLRILTICALFRLALASASVLNTLTLLVTITRRTVLQKVPHHTLTCFECL